jgi:hypothetical protein
VTEAAEKQKHSGFRKFGEGIFSQAGDGEKLFQEGWFCDRRRDKPSLLWFGETFSRKLNRLDIVTPPPRIRYSDTPGGVTICYNFGNIELPIISTEKEGYLGEVMRPNHPDHPAFIKNVKAYKNSLSFYSISNQKISRFEAIIKVLYRGSTVSINSAFIEVSSVAKNS